MFSVDDELTVFPFFGAILFPKMVRLEPIL